jgi:uncharacterized protein (TIGR03790 family)
MKYCKKPVRLPVLLLSVFLLFPAWIPALEPAEVVVIANRQVIDSIVLAKYYMERRGIPAGNLVTVGTTRNESVSREDYERDIRRPILYALARLLVGKLRPQRTPVLRWRGDAPAVKALQA